MSADPARNLRRPASDSAIAVSIPPPRRESRVLSVLRAALGVALIVGLASGVAYGARRYVRTSHRFAVAEIVTSGNKRRSPDEIASLAGIGKGQNVFALDLDRARARLVADAWIESAELSRQLPSTITIRVVEKEAAGLLATNEGTYLVNHEGVVIKRVEASDPVDFHVVTGITLQALLDDREGTARAIRHALELANDYDRSPLSQRAPLQEVHLEAAGDMTLVVGKAGLVLRMGSAPYRRKLEQAVRIVAELDRRGAKPETIMLDDDSRPDRVVVRMR
jgi:cell division protein FtsQ